MSKVEFLERYTIKTSLMPLLAVRVGAADLAQKLRIPYWKEFDPGMGEMHSFAVRTVSIELLLVYDHLYHRELNHGLTTTIEIEAERFLLSNARELVEAALEELELNQADLAWWQNSPEASEWAQQEIDRITQFQTTKNFTIVMTSDKERQWRKIYENQLLPQLVPFIEDGLTDN
jgi:hypothetical protein